MLNLLRLSFLPQSADLGLLVLRLSLAVPMLILHGWPKFINFNAIAPKFLPLFGMPSNVSLGLAIFGELVCAALLIVGFLSRFAALNLAITLGVAFFIAHNAQFVGEKSGELAYVYFVGFLALVITGPGKFSVDGK